jgi:hypothetical protein
VNPKVKWIIGQRERGAERGYEHWQVFITCEQVTKRFMRELLPTAGYLELTKSAAYNKYIWKVDTRIGDQFEYGTKPMNRGVSTDWAMVRANAQSGNFSEIPDDIYVRLFQNLVRIRTANQRNVFRENVVVKVFCGASRTGKSRRAWFEAGPNAFAKEPLTKWWCTYNGEDNVVIDEFAGIVSLSNVLKWFDRYPCKGETKGGSETIRATKFWITSNLHPRRWYPDEEPERIVALMNRLEIHEFFAGTLWSPPVVAE